jgi:hypothetical protein
MKGYVAVTDPGWYEHLRRQPGPKDANFWRASTRAVRLEVGTPFFFKLKAPHRAVAGFGYFAGHTTAVARITISTGAPSSCRQSDASGRTAPPSSGIATPRFLADLLARVECGPGCSRAVPMGHLPAAVNRARAGRLRDLDQTDELRATAQHLPQRGVQLAPRARRIPLRDPIGDMRTCGAHADKATSVPLAIALPLPSGPAFPQFRLLRQRGPT